MALINFLIESNDYPKALHYVKKSLQSNSDSLQLWKKSAEIHFKINFYEEAAIASKTAIELGNHDFKTWIISMDAQMHLKEWGAAMQMCQEALQLYSDQSAILYRLAGCKMRLGHKEEAQIIFNKIKSNFKIPEGFSQLFPELAKAH